MEIENELKELGFKLLGNGCYQKEIDDFAVTIDLKYQTVFWYNEQDGDYPNNTLSLCMENLDEILDYVKNIEANIPVRKSYNISVPNFIIWAYQKPNMNEYIEEYGLKFDIEEL